MPTDRGTAKQTPNCDGDIAALSRDDIVVMLDHLPAMVAQWDLELRCVFANQTCLEWFGLSPDEIRGRHISEMLGPEVYSERLGHIRGALRGDSQVFERNLVDIHGERHHVQVSFTPHVVDGVVDGFFALTTDVTARVEAEKALREKTQELALLRQREALAAQTEQSRRLESLGLLAGGIAHDFNNLLGVITNYAKLAQTEVTDEQVADDLQEIRRAADRGAALTSQLLTFARHDTVAGQTIDLNRVVCGIMSMVGRTLGAHIDVCVDLADEPLMMVADPHQIEQIVLNLALNARDAMPDGGTLSVMTRRRGTESPAGADADLEGDFVLCIQDTGCGMEPGVVTRAFEPFFTTKPAGEGTGLGLASVYGIVTHAGGQATIESQVGSGTAVTVVLPSAGIAVEVAGDDCARP